MATFKASPARWESSCNAAVASSHPLEITIASNTCLYCSQLVVPPNRGTSVVVNAACRGVGITGGTPGVLSCRDSALISAKSCCNRTTVSIEMFSGDHGTFQRSKLTSLSRASVKIWGATRVPLGGNRGPGARRPPCQLTSLLGGVTTRSSVSRPITPSAASRTLGSSGTIGGHPARFHFG